MAAPKIRPDIPIDRKYLLTFYEASSYFNVGVNRLRELAKDPACDFAVKTGDRKTMIIREKMQDYILSHRVI